MKTLPRTMDHVCAVLVLCATTAIALPAQTFTTLYTFCSQSGCTDGEYPNLGLVQATDDNFYGTTSSGGKSNQGTVFKITPQGALTTLHSFCPQAPCSGGSQPAAGLVQATNGYLYGTTYTSSGGSEGGTVFKITLGGKLTTLYTFCSQGSYPYCPDGTFPQAALVQATNGDLYGTTLGGGSDNCTNGCGTVFKITPSGTLTTLYSFCSQSGCTDGASPYAGLVQATNGDLYGTTFNGGTKNSGTVFKITPSGTLTTLHSFCSQEGPDGCMDGFFPWTVLVQATNGYLYGTTVAGGGSENAGTIFKITPSGKLTTLYSFCSLSGGCPYAGAAGLGLVQATDGNLYGTDSGNAEAQNGTVYEMTPSGTLTTVYGFPDSGIAGPLVQATNGDFYGTGCCGGQHPEGVVGSLSTGLGPFLKTLPASGKVGTAVKILGTNLTGATSVGFNGTAALFRVASSSEITTTVPVGASSGTVQVVTPSGTLSTYVAFTVP